MVINVVGGTRQQHLFKIANFLLVRYNIIIRKDKDQRNNYDPYRSLR